MKELYMKLTLNDNDFYNELNFLCVLIQEMLRFHDFVENTDMLDNPARKEWFIESIRNTFDNICQLHYCFENREECKDYKGIGDMLSVTFCHDDELPPHGNQEDWYIKLSPFNEGDFFCI